MWVVRDQDGNERPCHILSVAKKWLRECGDGSCIYEGRGEHCKPVHYTKEGGRIIHHEVDYSPWYLNTQS